ncbi:hypothetical protein VNO78_31076 [Psophocarpus tetragonolobus]|uniref:Uncharacterized protein n=1 Tax=Psophocarpus tetragonolobus TaxID=3891 RepID=A0AAN9RXS9_PSOTE
MPEYAWTILSSGVNPMVSPGAIGPLSIGYFPFSLHVPDSDCFVIFKEEMVDADKNRGILFVSVVRDGIVLVANGPSGISVMSLGPFKDMIRSKLIFIFLDHHIKFSNWRVNTSLGFMRVYLRIAIEEKVFKRGKVASSSASVSLSIPKQDLKTLADGRLCSVQYFWFLQISLCDL